MLGKYDAIVNGVRTTLLLTEAEAKARGLTETKAAPVSANKARRPRANKAKA